MVSLASGWPWSLESLTISACHSGRLVACTTVMMPRAGPLGGSYVDMDILNPDRTSPL
jgi:hypothetical protein